MKKLVVTLVALSAVLAVGALAYGWLFRADPAQRTWTVSTLTGDVEVSLAGGGWRAASIKLPLHDGDRIRTAADAEVTLLHDSSHVTVRAGTQLEVSQLNADSSRFQVAEGQVYVEARGNRVTMRTQAGATMDAEDAGVGMTVKTDGWTQVQVKRGAVDFTAMDHTERVEEGEESHASVGGPPSKPETIPSILLLNVRFPDADTFNSRVARIEGKADPGTRVRVGDASVDVGADGRFAADVTLDEGINQIEVAATDSIGNQRTETSQPIRVDTRPPGLDGATIGSHSVAAGGHATEPGGAPGPAGGAPGTSP